MAITYSWQIASLERELPDNYVYTAHWTVRASEPTGQTNDEGQPTFYAAEVYGQVGFSRPDNLIPYDSLTEEIVIGWVKDELGKKPESADPENPNAEPGKSKLEFIEETLSGSILAQKNPKGASGTPW